MISINWNVEKNFCVESYSIAIAFFRDVLSRLLLKNRFPSQWDISGGEEGRKKKRKRGGKREL